MRFIMLCFIAVCFVLPVAAQDVPSPDGEIAFTSNREGGIYQIYVMKADGSHVRQLTSGNTDAVLPLWSPDGQKIAFSRDTGDLNGTSRLFALWVMDANGQDAVEIARDEGQNFIVNIGVWMSWSPDSKHLLYRRYTGDNNISETYIVDVGGLKTQKLPEDLETNGLIYFLTNDMLIVTESDALYATHLLTYDLFTKILTPLGEGGPVVRPSPDGTLLAEMDGSKLLIMDLDTKEVRVLQETLTGLVPNEQAHIVYVLHWSADGSRLAGVMRAELPYQADATPDPAAVLPRDLLFTVSSNGKTYAAFETVDPLVSLSPDGDYITYTIEDKQGDYQIAITRADGTGTPELISTQGQSSQPAWRPVP